MRILQITPYVTNNSIPIPNRNITGFGYMVYDIAKFMAMHEGVDCLVLNKRYQSFVYDKINFLGISWFGILKYLFSCIPIWVWVRLIIKYSLSLKSIVHTGYYWLLSGLIRKTLKEGHYDIVHIHGAGLYTEFVIDSIQKSNVAFLLTLHGLVSFSDSVVLEKGIKKFEKDLLTKSLLNKWYLSVISIGMKKKIESYLGEFNIKRIHVINNFIPELIDNKCNGDGTKIRDIYNIPDNAKIILYVGNISKHKNQELMVKAYSLLPRELKHKVYVLFCGNIKNDGNNVSNLIYHSDFKEHLILCGNIPKENINNYYSQSNAVALLSVSEGFGLGLIEGMHYGLPCIASRSIESFEDLYSKEAMIGVDIDNIDDVVKGLESLLTSHWNQEIIKKYSLRFDSSKIIESYLSLFRKIINEK